jgi:hypothetical protein
MYTDRDYKLAREHVKQSITIPMLLQKLFNIQCSNNQKIKSPFRGERNASFSVFGGGRRFKDHTTGFKGDVFNVYMEATKCDGRQALIDLLAMAGGDAIGFSTFTKAPSRQEERKPQHHPELQTPTVDELKAISNLRSIKVTALQLAVDEGFLFTATLKDVRAFILTDKTRKSYLARKLDGSNWEHIGCKAYTLSGSQANWPIGIVESEKYPAIAITEGVPDFLSAFHLVVAFGAGGVVAPVCISGASVTIPEEALPYLWGKRIRIFAHQDQAGQAAAGRWTEQLQDMAMKVDLFSFQGLRQHDGHLVKDLNDLLKISTDSYRQNAKRIRNVMRF